MNYVGQVWNRVFGVYKTFNPATLSGAIDIIVIEQPDGTLRSTPFHVRFGKMGILRPKENIVDLHVNDNYIQDVHMQLGEAGEAFFLTPATDEIVKLNEEILCPPEIKVVDSSEHFSDTSSVCSESSEALGPVSYYSDGEQNQSDGTNRLEVSTESSYGGYKSDGDSNEHPRVQLHNAAEQIAAQLKWEWGKLPHSTTLDDVNHNNGDISPGRSRLSSGDCYLSEVDPVNAHVYLGPSSEYNYCHSPESGYKSDTDVLEDELKSGVQLSLCGGLNHTISPDRFVNHLVSYDEFIKNPSELLENPDLVVRIQGKNYNWMTAAPILLSKVAFGTNLPEKSISALNGTKRKDSIKKQRRTWFYWGRSSTANVSYDPEQTPVPTEPETPTFSGDIEATLTESMSQIARDELAAEIKGIHINIEDEFDNITKLVPTVRLTSDQLKLLQLKSGFNEVTFSVTTKYQGTSRCTCGIHFWKSTDRIVISDIDGTITKSDVLGHILPAIGRDWTQQGVAHLFSAIKRNNYKMVYLSARAIGQSVITKKLLQRIQQEGVPLPDGPLLLSPASLLRALQQEVILKNSDQFKISCLTDLKSLFPENCSPFWAGFGNKPTDANCYRNVGVERSRCFTVNHLGQLTNNFIKSSYKNMADTADHYFPPFLPTDSAIECQQFNHLAYWNSPVMELPNEHTTDNHSKH